MRRRADYHYPLPAELIAQVPADCRGGSRLLCPNQPASLRHRQFSELIELLPDNAVVVANDARVRRARIHTHKAETGGAVELLLLEPSSADGQWRALARASKPIRLGVRLVTSSGQHIEVVRGRSEDGSIIVHLPQDATSLCSLDGELPLPPYIQRPDGPLDADSERYQTVFATEMGAIAAPTAGLHFNHETIAAISARGMTWATLTLDVGLGTFAPVRDNDIDKHSLHSERYRISAETAAAVNSGRPVVAIGTTVVRALESAWIEGGGVVRAGPSVTELFITPGYSFGVVTHLVTNFHLPESSLLMLVAAFAGYQLTLDAYNEAVAAGYRFFSYGDAMFLDRDNSAANSRPDGSRP